MGLTLQSFEEFLRKANFRNKPQGTVFDPEHASKVGTADAGGVLQHCVEDRIKLARRRTDNAKHVGCGRLLLQRFAEIGRGWRSSLSNRAFSMAMTACAAKFLTSSICFSVNGRTSVRYMAIAPRSSCSFTIGT